MTREETQHVKRWLYSMATTEQAIYNLELAIEDLQARIENPPSYIVSGVGNYSGISYSGGEGGGSKEQGYAEWLEMCESRLSFLEHHLDKHKRKVEQYRETLEKLKQEPKWGYTAGEIIRKKYYCKVRPDQAIYAMFLFISPEWYYKLHKRALRYFFDVLPDVFLRQK
ncbi:hypothetical protein [Pelotomaculum propionicicum]|uniref:Uncharacterized protein n=1 Tax=Pelotomaculum propionicicum TaxID=258475 RepID=A0A4Y7RX92_9FIRM|nr:hypothetical protein [Pelotomaculum propionicicum]TEB13380.1 hypothetical protein Pmgp_00274 [Pelotomaculum propionicicum]